MHTQPIIAVLSRYAHDFHPVVAFEPGKDRLLQLDFTAANEALTGDIIDDANSFSTYINQTLLAAGARYGIGGYAEHRTVYSRSRVFDAADGGEPRRLHLGVDIWGPAGTPVYAFMGGMVHSVGFHNRLGDYGAVLILSHQLDAYSFYTLYGHISLADVQRWEPGRYVNRGEQIAVFGAPHENGQWPPHLHMQVIADLELHEGDYPGVCRLSDRDFYLHNCPDPDLILQLNQHLGE